MTDLRKAAEMALEFVDWLCGDDHSVKPKNKALDVRESLRQALAQPEREPVAWADKVGAVIPHSHKLFQPDLLKDYTRPLYTAPPKREWVGLTDDELKSLCDEWQIIYGGYVRPFAETIEAKLKEKNT